MSNVSFQVNGKNISARSFQNEIERAVFEQIKESIEQSVRSIQCSIHHEHPKVMIKGKDLNSLGIEVKGCCDTLIESTLSKLQQ